MLHQGQSWAGSWFESLLHSIQGSFRSLFVNSISAESGSSANQQIKPQSSEFDLSIRTLKSRVIEALPFEVYRHTVRSHVPDILNQQVDLKSSHDQWPFWIQNLPGPGFGVVPSSSKSHKTRCFCSRLKAVCWWLCWCTLGVVAIATGLAQENLYSRRARRRQQEKTTWWSRSWNFSTFMELKLTKPGFLVDYIIHMLTISYYIIIRLPYVTIQSHGSSPLQTCFFLCRSSHVFSKRWGYGVQRDKAATALVNVIRVKSCRCPILPKVHPTACPRVCNYVCRSD